MTDSDGRAGPPGRSMRVLMVTPLALPETGAEGLVAAKLGAAVLEAGWGLDVLARSDVHHYFPESADEFWQGYLKMVVAGPGDGDRRSGGALKRRLRWGTAHWTAWARKRVESSLRQREYDLIVSRAAPLYGHLPVLLSARSRQVPWVAHWSDPMPPELAPPPYGTGRAHKARWWAMRYCKAVARRASWHTFPSHRLMRYMEGYLPEMSGRCSVVRPTVEPPRRRPLPEKAPEGLHLCVPGSVIRRPVEGFLRGFKLFLERNPGVGRATVRIIGTGQESHRGLVSMLGLQGSVTFEDSLPYEAILGVMAHSSANVILETPHSPGIFLPSKITDCVTSGRLIFAITPAESELRDLLGDSPRAVLVPGDEPCMVAEGLAVLASLCARQGVVAVDERLENDLSPQRALSELANILDACGGTRR